MSGPLSPGETASNVQDGGTPGLSPVAGHIWIPVRRDPRSYESIVSIYYNYYGTIVSIYIHMSPLFSFFFGPVEPVGAKNMECPNHMKV